MGLYLTLIKPGRIHQLKLHKILDVTGLKKFSISEQMCAGFIIINPE